MTVLARAGDVVTPRTRDVRATDPPPSDSSAGAVPGFFGRSSVGAGVTASATSLHGFRRNLTVNLVGRGWSAVMALAFVPVYLRMLGAEGYGLIALCTTFQASFAIIDVGLTTTLNRELAVRAASGLDARHVLRTLEVVYWIAAAIGALTIMGASGWIAAHWVKANTLPVSEVRHAIVLMAFVLAFQWPLGFYSGGLLGLERQVTANALLIATSTLRYAGAALVLVAVSADLRSFFLWQVMVSGSSAVLTAGVLWSYVGNLGGRDSLFRHWQASGVSLPAWVQFPRPRCYSPRLTRLS